MCRWRRRRLANFSPFISLFLPLFNLISDPRCAQPSSSERVFGPAWRAFPLFPINLHSEWWMGEQFQRLELTLE
jgi:hypothetical protein